MAALEGLKVLDFSTLLPGPYATLMLADMGAEVLKISSSSKYDLVMDYGTCIEGTDISACQAWLGRNKKTMYDYYETSDGEYMSVGSLEPKFWENLCRTLGREDLIKGTVRPEDPEEVKEQLRQIFRTKTKAEWTKLFSGVDACVQPVLDLREALLEDPQIQAREMVIEIELPLHEGIKVKQMGTAIRLSETPCEYHYAGYPLGYHTKQIIEKLGLDYQELARKGVFD